MPTASTTTMTPSAAAHNQSSNEVDILELLRMSRILANQWLRAAVWGKVLEVMTPARNVLRNLVRKENWLKVRAIFIAQEQ